MKIALVGYGKMGKLIEQIALERGHEVILRINRNNVSTDFNAASFQSVDVVIEFTNPEIAFHNVSKCLEWGKPVVCGSTGWNEKIQEANVICLKNNTSFITASNFSIGVQLFWRVNQYLSKLMNTHKDYQVHVEETHHVHKKDAPSGTAITTVQQIIDQLDNKDQWQLGLDNKSENVIPVVAHRIDEVPGTHEVIYQNDIDAIALKHTAFTRNGFALGAVVAAEYIYNKKGIYTMQDVLAF